MRTDVDSLVMTGSCDVPSIVLIDGTDRVEPASRRSRPITRNAGGIERAGCRQSCAASSDSTVRLLAAIEPRSRRRHLPLMPNQDPIGSTAAAAVRLVLNPRPVERVLSGRGFSRGLTVTGSMARECPG